MKLTGTEDLRVQKTVEAIRSTYEQLLLERGATGRITVKELCEIARINKKTFYRYYSSLDDLAAELQQEEVDEYLEHIRGLRIPEDIPQITSVFFHFLEEKGPLMQAITTQPRFDSMQRLMERNVMAREDDSVRDYPLRRTVVAYVTSATMGVYRDWVAHGRDLPLDTVVSATTELLTKGTGPLLKAQRHR